VRPPDEKQQNSHKQHLIICKIDLNSHTVELLHEEFVIKAAGSAYQCGYDKAYYPFVVNRAMLLSLADEREEIKTQNMSLKALKK
jgi:hypothetical protein